MSAHLHLPNRKRSVCEVTIAWHYTVGLKLPAIRESGVLRAPLLRVSNRTKNRCAGSRSILTGSRRAPKSPISHLSQL